MILLVEGLFRGGTATSDVRAVVASSDGEHRVGSERPALSRATGVAASVSVSVSKAGEQRLAG